MKMDEERNKELGELIVELAQGNILVLDRISELVEQILMSIGNIYYRNRADVEDRVHDLYCSLPDKAEYFKSNKNACAWIVRIFYNSIKSNLRFQNREKRYWEKECGNLKAASNIADERYVDNHLFLREILERLTNEERLLVIYYHWCNCTVREVADILHKPRSTVHNKLRNLEKKVKNF